MKRRMDSPKLRMRMSPKKYDLDFRKDVVYDIEGKAQAAFCIQ